MKCFISFYLAGGKRMPETHIRQPGSTYSACGPLTKYKERIQNFKETGDSRYIYQSELNKACFQHDLAYGNFKDLARRTASGKILCDKAFDISKNSKYDGYQRGLASKVYKFFDKKSALLAWSETSATRDKSDSGSTIKNENISNNGLGKKLHKPVIRKFKKRKVQSPFIGNIWDADLANMQLICKFDKGFRFFLCVIDIYSKYPWVLPLKDKKGITIINAFKEILKEFNRKHNKIWLDKGSEFL